MSRWSVTLSLSSSSTEFTSHSLSQSRLFGQPYRHISPTSGDMLPLDTESPSPFESGKPRVLSAKYNCVSAT